MAQWLDSQEVHGIVQGIVDELFVIQRHGHAHRINEHARRLGGIVLALGEGVSGLDSAEVGDCDGLSSSHFCFPQ